MRWRGAERIAQQEQVCLPTQEEWMWAARGSPAPANTDEDYPWRGPFDPTHANTQESNLGQTSPVHTYPTGVTPEGVWDMAGNVWEWTADKYKEIEGWFWLKGGSSFQDKSNVTAAAAAAADLISPRLWYVDHGFRCLVFPISR